MNGVVSTTIKGCNIYSNDRAGIATAQLGSNSDELTSDSSIIIKGNTIGGSGQGNSRAGIYLDGSGSGVQITIGGSFIDEVNTISWNTNAGIVLEDIDQVIIENNDISNNSDAGILLIDVSTVSPHIKNNDIYNHAFEAGINIGGASSVTIGDNNDIHSNRAGIVFYVSTNSRVTGSASSQPVTITGNNIYSNHYAGIAIRDPITNTQDTTITENDIYLNGANGGGGIGIQNQCKLVITKNKIRDNVRGGIHTGKDLAGGVGFLGTNGSADLTIRQNKIYNNGGSDYGAGIDVRHASGTIYNNLVYDNHKGGIRFGDYITHIINNTVVDNGNDNDTADLTDDRGGGIVYDDLAGEVNDTPGGSPSAALDIRNNICAYNQKAGIRVCFDNSLEERDYNLLYDNNYTGGYCTGRYMAKQLAASECGLQLGADPDATNAANEIYGDPLFVDRDNDNYQLQVGSPAIDAGDDANDMGAYGGAAPIGW